MKGWVDGRMGGWKDGGQLMKCFAPFSRGVFVRKVVYRPRMDAFPDLCWTQLTESASAGSVHTDTPHSWNLCVELNSVVNVSHAGWMLGQLFPFFGG